MTVNASLFTPNATVDVVLGVVRIVVDGVCFVVIFSSVQDCSFPV